jgi:NADH-quinone oxidoreductase subunit E
MMIDDMHYQDLDPARIDEILAHYGKYPQEEKRKKNESADGNTADP